MTSKVAVLGLGFVGSAMSVAIASSKNNKGERNFDVVGIDLPTNEGKKRIKAINNGNFPFKTNDKKLISYLNKCYEAGNLIASSSDRHIKNADIIVVDINLDASKIKNSNQKIFSSFDVDMSPFKKSMNRIASICKPTALILIETTVPPGTSEKIILPIFQKYFKKRNIEIEPCIAHSYERVMPGPNYLDSIINFPRVYSGTSIDSERKCFEFLSKVISKPNKNLKKLHSTSASEMSKVLENSYRAMNIAFIDEWSKFADNSKVNIYEVLEVIRDRPTHSNIMSPGLGVGGYCLTKDPLLASWSSQQLFNADKLRLSEKAVKVNDLMPTYTFSLVKKNFPKKSKILICGLSYISGVGDDRYTPVELLYELLLADGFDIEIIDPYLDKWTSKNMIIKPSPQLKGYDGIIIGTAHQEYRSNKFFSSIKKLSPKVIVDCWNILKDKEFNITTQVITLGNGLQS